MQQVIPHIQLFAVLSALICKHLHYHLMDTCKHDSFCSNFVASRPDQYGNDRDSSPSDI